MSRVCRKCLKTVDDPSRKFCPYCGEVIDSDLKLVMDVDKAVKSTKAAKPSDVKRKENFEPERSAGKSRYDNDDIVFTHKKKEEKKSGAGAALAVAVIAVICVAAYFLFVK
ncbi:MAG: hypothetical protein HFE62_03805 [Firmicutes bacterium]|nr:hypothetical protein [Bacillota bacterium]